MVDKVVFLTTTGANVWSVPVDWTDVNTIECIGGGGNGAAVYNTGNPDAGRGGTYAKTTNLDLAASGSANYNISAGNTGDTWISNTGVAPTSSTEGALAKPNLASTTGCIGSTTFAGGNTASGGSSGLGHGAGGGASRGGRGGNSNQSASGFFYTPGGGGAGTTNQGGDASGITPGAGGATGGGAGGTGVAAVSAVSGGNGAAGTSFTSTLGATAGAGGGGGCGQGVGQKGGDGGLYGGGGGNIRSTGAGTTGVGAQGIIIITYTPAVLGGATSYAWFF
jgi:hypothetical protein